MKQRHPHHNAIIRTYREQTQPALFENDTQDISKLPRQNSVSAPNNAMPSNGILPSIVIGVCIRCSGDATVASPGGSAYCTSHSGCARCHRSITAFVFDTMRGLWLCPCVIHYGETVAQGSLV